jgi:hypothetical protein
MMKILTLKKNEYIRIDAIFPEPNKFSFIEDEDLFPIFAGYLKVENEWLSACITRDYGKAFEMLYDQNLRHKVYKKNGVYVKVNELVKMVE